MSRNVGNNYHRMPHNITDERRSQLKELFDQCDSFKFVKTPEIDVTPKCSALNHFMNFMNFYMYLMMP